MPNLRTEPRISARRILDARGQTETRRPGEVHGDDTLKRRVGDTLKRRVGDPFPPRSIAESGTANSSSVALVSPRAWSGHVSCACEGLRARDRTPVRRAAPGEFPQLALATGEMAGQAPPLRRREPAEAPTRRSTRVNARNSLPRQPATARAQASGQLWARGAGARGQARGADARMQARRQGLVADRPWRFSRGPAASRSARRLREREQRGDVAAW